MSSCAISRRYRANPNNGEFDESLSSSCWNMLCGQWMHCIPHGWGVENTPVEMGDGCEVTA